MTKPTPLQRFLRIPDSFQALKVSLKRTKRAISSQTPRSRRRFSRKISAQNDERSKIKKDFITTDQKSTKSPIKSKHQETAIASIIALDWRHLGALSFLTDSDSFQWPTKIHSEINCTKNLVYLNRNTLII